MIGSTSAAQLQTESFEVDRRELHKKRESLSTLPGEISLELAAITAGASVVVVTLFILSVIGV